MLDRRQLLKALGASAATAGLLAPPTLAGRGSGERKFLFVYLDGGWDTLKFATPKFDAGAIEMEDGAGLAEAHGIPFVTSERRPAVDTFMEAYGDRCCVVNGMEVQSVAHEACRRILMTGESQGGFDDWPSIIAAHSSLDTMVLPYVVMSGWAYTGAYTSSVVRVGANGQLPDLLDGTAVEASRTPVSLPSQPLQDLADSWLQARVDALAAEAPPGRRQEFHAGYERLLGDLQSLGGSQDLALEVPYDGCTRDLAATSAAIFDLMEAGMTRCGMVSFRGLCDYGWDGHVDIAYQDNHYEFLFDYLLSMMEDLATRTAPSGAPLEEELVVVVCSEMGRHPILNSGIGRDHWTYTSFMLLGAGVQGGQVIGGVDDDFVGQNVDPVSGEVSDAGEALVAKHLGATLLTLAGLDPGDHIAQGGSVLEAALQL